MSPTLYYVLSGLLVFGVLVGIYMMSKVRTALLGNLLGAACLVAGVIITLLYNEILSATLIWIGIAVGLVLGIIWAMRAKMIKMPQIVALYNGFGGGASAIVAFLTLIGPGMDLFTRSSAGIALAAGMCTLSGSLVAAAKLAKFLPQSPTVWKRHSAITAVTLFLTLALVGISAAAFLPPLPLAIALVVFSFFFGVVFTIRVGGADMPITISLLNSLSGVSGAIAGMAVGDILLITVGGIVGASGLLLTQIMCKSMNRSLGDILLGRTSVKKHQTAPSAVAPVEDNESESTSSDDPALILKTAKDIIIVPGYGMALAQAQHLVKELADKLEENGAKVRFAIHPVAGRMPGHMNVLLSEADIFYDSLFELEAINDDFEKSDVVIIIGANDVVNPAARDAEGTPIYGMPILNADKAAHVIICNYDLNPGYAGVDNPLYKRKTGLSLLLGDAKDSLQSLLSAL